MALRLSKTLGRSPESWLTMQDHYDLWNATKKVNLRNVENWTSLLPDPVTLEPIYTGNSSGFVVQEVASVHPISVARRGSRTSLSGRFT